MPIFANENHVMRNEERKGFGAPVVPPSPTISTRSSDMGGGSGSSIPRVSDFIILLFLLRYSLSTPRL